MPDLSFEVRGARPLTSALVPQIALTIGMRVTPEVASVRSILLRCQVNVEPRARTYDDVEGAALTPLFGARTEWSRSQSPLAWTQITTVVSELTGEGTVDIALPCSFDVHVAVGRLLHALREGEVPLRLLLSGTVFHEDESGALRAEPIPWSKEATYRLPIAVWQETMRAQYADAQFVALPAEVVARLRARQTALGHVDLGQTVQGLLEHEHEHEGES